MHMDLVQIQKSSLISYKQLIAGARDRPNDTETVYLLKVTEVERKQRVRKKQILGFLTPDSE